MWLVRNWHIETLQRQQWQKPRYIDGVGPEKNLEPLAVIFMFLKFASFETKRKYKCPVPVDFLEHFSSAQIIFTRQLWRTFLNVYARFVPRVLLNIFSMHKKLYWPTL